MQNITNDISYQPPGQFEETRYEKIHNVVFDTSGEGSKLVAAEIAALIREKQAKSETCVLGLATGSSPIKVYEELVRMHKEENLSFANVVTFNLDEYYPMPKESIHSYHYFMNQHLFNHVDIKPENINIPDGTVPKSRLMEYCIAYDEKIASYGGIDFQLLGIGRTGHIGFNEPGSHINSGTRYVMLDPLTRSDAAPGFFGIENVPRAAITMGIRTIMQAKRIVLLAWGNAKAPIVKRTIEGEMTSDVPATYLQKHHNTTFVLDEEASQELTRIKTPWLVKDCKWNDDLIKKSVVWLSDKTQKSILKLTEKDYNAHGLSGLMAQEGDPYHINIRVFNWIQHTITGWPGGKPDADDTYRPERAMPYPKRVLIFSPHPDDDVISMGGTIDRLVEQGHEVHVAYQKSGSIAVADEQALKFARVMKTYQPDNKFLDEIIGDLQTKEKPFEDSLAVRNLKAQIRRQEAIGALTYLGVPLNHIHFLDMPFYETGAIKKKPLSKGDYDLVTKIIKRIKPHQIFAAGDLADPHGTHKICLDAIYESIDNLKTEPFMKKCYVWLYRGAWHEWDVPQIDMAVPMSPDQVLRKRKAIFYHETQKDGVMFQGNDPREFWVRAEERNHETAVKYNKLGLADYAAIEAFKRYKF